MAADKMTLLADGGKKRKGKQPTTTQYGIYSGIVKDDGSTDRNPTQDEAVSNMAKYMKKNTPESNVYRPKFQHTSVNYDRKKSQSNS